MWKHIQRNLAYLSLFSFLQAGPSVYLYVIQFENITQEKSIDWMSQGFVDMIHSKMGDSDFLKLRNQEDLEEIMKNRTLLLHQPRGSRNFLLLGKFERKLDQVHINVQLVDIATWEEVDRRKMSGYYNEVSSLNLKLASTVETMLGPFIPEIKLKSSIYPEFSIDKSPIKKSNIFTESKKVGRNIDTAIGELEKTMDFVIGARSESSKDVAVKTGDEWVLEIGKNSQPDYNPENDANTNMLMDVLDNLMNSPYDVDMKKPVFEYDIDDAKIMNVLFEVVYSLKDHIIQDMLKSLPYSGLKQDGSLMYFFF